MSRKNHPALPALPVSPLAMGRRIAARACPVAAALSLGLAALPVQAANFTVSTIADSGPGSLREAINQANAKVGPDTVVFASSISSVIGLTIPLSSGPIFVTDSVTINGPGADRMIVDGGDASIVFYSQIPGTGNVTISGLTITRGFSGGLGGGIFMDDDNLTLRRSVVSNSNATDDGGGIWSTGKLVLEDSVISGNTAGDLAGGIYLYDTNGDGATIRNSRITDNTAATLAGGFDVFRIYGPLVIENSVISGNEATANVGGGGVIAFVEDVTLRNLLVHDNTAGSDGGGVYLRTNSGPAVITGSSFYNNTAANYGGGLAITDVYNVTSLVNSTLSGNNADDGAGVALGPPGSGGSLRILSSTIASNTAATNGGGIYNQTDVLVTNTIVADNTAGTGPDIFSAAGDVFVSFNSLFEDDSGADLLALSNTQTGTDPSLLPLADNGGRSLTHALDLGSAAIDTGDNSQCALATVGNVDQRGVARPVDGDVDAVKTCDIGAYEFNGGTIQCGAAPAAGCEMATSASFSIFDRAGSTTDSLAFSFKGAQLMAGFFGDPRTFAGTANVVCIYDGGANLVGSLSIPAGEPNARGLTQWRLTGTRTNFTSTINPDGVRSIAQDSGRTAAAGSKVSVAAGGVRFVPPVLPITGPVLVQNVTSNGGNCVEAEFTNITSNSMLQITGRLP